MSEIRLDNQTFADKILKENTVALVDFYADWCGPCKMVAPIIEEIAEEYEDVVVGKINVDENIELATKYGVSSIPTIIAFKNGVESSRIIGYRPKEEIEKMIM
ncbi:MAG: thioredoxin [Ruminococcus sp.]|nr:thioredoxin [Ruminococcus sp.]